MATQSQGQDVMTSLLPSYYTTIYRISSLMESEIDEVKSMAFLGIVGNTLKGLANLSTDL